jgi:ABC-type lipoprotein export system ATPase subunit
MTGSANAGSASAAAAQPAGVEPAIDVHEAFRLHPLRSGAVVALRGLTLRVPQGERLVVHGPNGSGKTTLLQVLAGEQSLSSGRAVVGGFDLATAGRRDRDRWRVRALGRVEQDVERVLRPELDVLANVALQSWLAGLGRTAARAAARRELDRLGLAHLARRRPGSLSGGEAQRVAVCAALAHGPSLVLADEPTGELDEESADAVYTLLSGAVLAAGATLVLVTHDPRAVRIADRVVRIRDGRLSEVWHPGGPAPVTERLVVDDRGWLRLPAALRAQVAAAGEVSAEPGPGDRVVLSPAPNPPVIGQTFALHESAQTRSEGAEPEGGESEGGESEGGESEGGGSEGAESEGAESEGGGPRGGEFEAARLRGVSVTYGARRVFGPLDLTVRAGRLLVVRGRSGSGKSTLLRVLVGLERPDTGTVLLGGVDLGTLDRGGLARIRREQAAVLTQRAQLADALDAAANLALARAVRGLPGPPVEPPADGVPAAADQLAVGQLGVGQLGIGHRPTGVLSGGERQRIAVARVLSVGARLLVLDEPTSRLDEAGVEAVAALLADHVRRSGAAVVVATHDPVLVAVADDVLDLAPARISSD